MELFSIRIQRTFQLVSTISTLLQMGNGHVTVYALLFFHRLH